MAAHKAYGNYRLQVGDGASPETFSTVAGVKSIDGPSTEMAFLETTTFDSSGGAREFVPTLKDPGSLTMALLFQPDSASHEDLVADHDARTLRNFKLRLVDATTDKIWSFSAYVASISPKAEVDGLIEAQVSLRVTGDINRAAT